MFQNDMLWVCLHDISSSLRVNTDLHQTLHCSMQNLVITVSLIQNLSFIYSSYLCFFFYMCQVKHSATLAATSPAQQGWSTSFVVMLPASYSRLLCRQPCCTELSLLSESVSNTQTAVYSEILISLVYYAAVLISRITGFACPSVCLVRYGLFKSKTQKS